MRLEGPPAHDHGNLRPFVRAEQRAQTHRALVHVGILAAEDGDARRDDLGLHVNPLLRSCRPFRICGNFEGASCQVPLCKRDPIRYTVVAAMVTSDV
jgi:hypothetical protein